MSIWLPLNEILIRYLKIKYNKFINVITKYKHNIRFRISYDCRCRLLSKNKNSKNHSNLIYKNINYSKKS